MDCRSRKFRKSSTVDYDSYNFGYFFNFGDASNFKNCENENGETESESTEDWKKHMRLTEVGAKTLKENPGLFLVISPICGLVRGGTATIQHHIYLKPGYPGRLKFQTVKYRKFNLLPKTISRDNLRLVISKQLIANYHTWLFHLNKDVKLRFCVVYRLLNQEMVPDTFILPMLDDFIYSMGNEEVFTKFEAKSGYWQIPITSRYKNKTRFATHSGIYRYQTFPFGLQNRLEML